MLVKCSPSSTCRTLSIILKLAFKKPQKIHSSMMYQSVFSMFYLNYINQTHAFFTKLFFTWFLKQQYDPKDPLKQVVSTPFQEVKFVMYLSKKSRATQPEVDEGAVKFKVPAWPQSQVFRTVTEFSHLLGPEKYKYSELPEH